MALGSKVYYAVDVVVGHQLLYRFIVADVRLHEHVVLLILNVLQVCQVAGVSQLVEVDNPVLRVLVDEQAHYVRADEAGSARYHYVTLEFHFCFSVCVS